MVSRITRQKSDHQRRDVWTNHRADLPNVHWRVSSKESQSATGRQKLIAFERLTRVIPEHKRRAAQAARQKAVHLWNNARVMTYIYLGR
jgi:hypothetical protein